MEPEISEYDNGASFSVFLGYEDDPVLVLDVERAQLDENGWLTLHSTEDIHVFARFDYYIVTE